MNKKHLISPHFPCPKDRIQLIFKLHNEVGTSQFSNIKDYQHYFYLSHFLSDNFSEEIEYLSNILYEAHFKTVAFSDLHFTDLHYFFWKEKGLTKDFDIDLNHDSRRHFLTFLYRHWRGQYLPTKREREIIEKTVTYLTPCGVFEINIVQQEVLKAALPQTREEVIAIDTCIKLLFNYFDFVDKPEVRLNQQEVELLEQFLSSILEMDNYLKDVNKELSFLKDIIQNNRPLAARAKKSPATQEVDIRIIGYPLDFSGLGEDARTTFNAIPDNLTKELYNLGNKSSEEFNHYLSSCNNLSRKAKVQIFNSPPNIGAIIYEKFGKEFFEGSYNIGYCPWELSNWKESLKDCFYFFDEIWAPSQFLYDCYSSLELSIPVKHVPLSVEIPLFKEFDREHFNLPKEKFLFYFSFDFNSSFYRKNPSAVLEAFNLAFNEDDDDIGLVFKFINPENSNSEHQDFLKKIRSQKNVYTIENFLSQNEVLSLYSCTDCFVSLHRSEGFGRCIAEAICLGSEVIATNYSGNLDFCNNQNSHLVDFDLTSNYIGKYIYSSPSFTWAEPKLEHVIALMRQVYQNNNPKRAVAVIKEMDSHSEARNRRIFEIFNELNITLNQNQ